MAVVSLTLFTQADVAVMEARYRAIPALIAALPAMDVSDQGRSISASAARAALIAEQKYLYDQLVLAAGPVFALSRMKA